MDHSWIELQASEEAPAFTECLAMTAEGGYLGTENLSLSVTDSRIDIIDDAGFIVLPAAYCERCGAYLLTNADETRGSTLGGRDHA